MIEKLTNTTCDVANGATHVGNTLPKELVDEMQRLFGKHTGHRTSMACLYLGLIIY